MGTETTEEWKPLEGFTNYLFSNMGNIKRISDGRIEKVTKSGIPQYYYVHLVPDGGKRCLYRLHRLIAQSWIPKPDDPKMKIVDHINRDKFDNRVENLRWVCNSMNQRNTEASYYAIYKGFWVHVKTFYKGNNPAYAYAYLHRKLTNDLEQLEELRAQSRHQKTVEWEGETHRLIDLCNHFNKDYDKVYIRYSTSDNIYAAMFYESNYRSGYDLQGIGGVRYQFSSLQEIADYLGVVIARVRDNIELCGNSLVELKYLINQHEPIDTRKTYIIDGVSKRRCEWIAYYETSDTRVKENMTKHKLPFEDAVKLPVQKVRKVLLNGEVTLVKDMWIKYGFVPKAVNTKKARWQTTFKQTLERLGIDVTNIEIVPL